MALARDLTSCETLRSQFTLGGELAVWVAVAGQGAGEPATAGTVVGLLAVAPRPDRRSAVELKHLCVAERCRGRGVARRLIESALAMADRTGAETVLLETLGVMVAAQVTPLCVASGGGGGGSGGGGGLTCAGRCESAG